MATIKNNKRILILVVTIIKLSSSCSLDKLDPSVKYDPCLGKVTSKFTHDKIGVTCDSPCTVKFTNLSTGAKTYRWDFGEGGTSSDPNPTYVFKKAGKWDVKLTVTADNNCSAVSMESVTITTPIGSVPVPDFTFSFSNDNQFAPSNVIFTNTSTNSVSYKWDFGDGKGKSDSISPSYYYIQPNSYTVTLESTNNSGVTKSINKVVTINTSKFTKTFGGSKDDYGYSIQQTSDGGYIICGMTNSEGAGNDDVYLIKTDLLGNKIWTNTYGGALIDRGFSVQQISDGGYIICGYTNSKSGAGGGGDVYLIKTNANGGILWDRPFGESKSESGSSVKQTQDGGFIVCGSTTSYGPSLSYVYLLKIDSRGLESWKKIYGNSSKIQNTGSSVSQTTDGGYILCGTSFGGGKGDIYLVKTNANGDSTWTKTYGLNDDHGSCVQQTKDGGYIICGTSVEIATANSDVYLIKTKANGDIDWTRIIRGESGDYGYSIQQTTDGGYIICGLTNSVGSGNSDAYLIKTKSNGEVDWKRTFGGASDDTANSVQQTADGGYIICGATKSQGAGGFDVYVIKTDKNGNVQ